MTAILNCTMQMIDTTLNKETTHSKAVINFKNLSRLLYNTSRMKQELIPRHIVKTLTRRHLHTLKIDLIGVTEKISKNH